MPGAPWPIIREHPRPFVQGSAGERARSLASVDSAISLPRIRQVQNSENFDMNSNVPPGYSALEEPEGYIALSGPYFWAKDALGSFISMVFGAINDTVIRMASCMEPPSSLSLTRFSVIRWSPRPVEHAQRLRWTASLWLRFPPAHGSTDGYGFGSYRRHSHFSMLKRARAKRCCSRQPQHSGFSRALTRATFGGRLFPPNGRSVKVTRFRRSNSEPRSTGLRASGRVSVVRARNR